MVIGKHILPLDVLIGPARVSPHWSNFDIQSLPTDLQIKIRQKDETTHEPPHWSTQMLAPDWSIQKCWLLIGRAKEEENWLNSDN